MPQVQPAPASAPLPTLPPRPSPTPSEISPQTPGDRTSRVRQIRAGYLSTIKNRGGAAGTGPELLSSMYGGKTKLGA